MQDYTRLAQIGGDEDNVCRALSLIGETNNILLIEVDEFYSNLLTFTGSIPITMTELFMPNFLTATLTVISESDIRLLIEGMPRPEDIGGHTIDVLLNNCVGGLPADAYDVLREIEVYQP